VEDRGHGLTYRAGCGASVLLPIETAPGLAAGEAVLVVEP
jgi:hypothetical protein